MGSRLLRHRSGRGILGGIIALLSVTAVTDLWGQPANDSCANAEVVVCNNSTIVVDNTGATPAAGNRDPELALGTPTCHWNGNPEAPHNTVWYQFQALDNQVFISTCETENLAGGTGFSDSIISLYEGDCNSLVELACAEDDCSTTPMTGLWLSELCYSNLQVGETYRVMVGNSGDWPGSTPGTVQIDFSCPCPSPPPDDNCQNAATVVTGLNPITTFQATDSGPDHGASSLCDIGGESDIRADIWKRWTADASGTAIFTLCVDTNFDTKMALYTADQCPPPVDGSTLLACDDDGCGAGFGPSLIEAQVQAGVDYFIRIGGFDAATGDGFLGISNPPSCGDGVLTPPEECDPPGPLCNPDCTFAISEVCSLTQNHPPDPTAPGGEQAFTSDLNVGITVADSFQAAQSGTITQLCWEGLYFDFQAQEDCGPGPGDDFTVTYYENDQGLPNVLLGQFPLNNVQKVVNDVVDTSAGPIVQYQFTASHPAVPVTANVCYWIEITNDTTGNCAWLWKTSSTGDGVIAQDGQLNGYELDERCPNPGGVDPNCNFDMAWSLNIATSATDCSQSCCTPGVSCLDDVGAADCLDLGGNFTTGTSCSNLDPPCGFGACCQPDGSCSDGLAGECETAGGQFHVNTTCAEIVCNNFDDCAWDNGVFDVSPAVTTSQFAPGAFVAEAADNFTFKGDSGTCLLQEIVVDVLHFGFDRCIELCVCPNGELFQDGVAADVCGTGNPNDCTSVTRGICSDGSFCYTPNNDPNECGGLGSTDCSPRSCTGTPDDYQAVQVVIYPDVGSTPGGFPTNDTVPCVSDAQCEPLIGGIGEATCMNNICVNSEGNPLLVPTGGHTGAQNEIVVEPANISWDDLGSDFYTLTLDLTFLPDNGLPILQNQKKWLAIVPQVPGEFFFQTGITTSLNFDGETAERVFAGAGVFPFNNLNPPRDLAFRLQATTQVGGPVYKRGDSDGNGTVNFLVDSLFLLNSGFVPGSPQPPCRATADVDGNRVVNALVDGLFGLNAGFVPNSPLPPAPFPDCGSDLNGFNLFGCQNVPVCP